DGAVVAVVAADGRAGQAYPALADLGAVADVAVAARRAVRARRVLAAGRDVAAVERARVAVAAVERRPGRAGAALAGLGAVAHVAVAARCVVGDGLMLAAGRADAGVGGARVAVVAARRRARAARPA